MGIHIWLTWGSRGPGIEAFIETNVQCRFWKSFFIWEPHHHEKGREVPYEVPEGGTYCSYNFVLLIQSR